MSSPLPLRPSIDHTPRPCSVIDLADEDSAAVLQALGSETARLILDALVDQPATATDIADEIGTSLQNVHYHLENLHDADLVAEAGTWYSSKGREMRVYALTSKRIDLCISSERDGVPTTEQTDTEGASSESSQPSLT